MILLFAPMLTLLKRLHEMDQSLLKIKMLECTFKIMFRPYMNFIGSFFQVFKCNFHCNDKNRVHSILCSEPIRTIKRTNNPFNDHKSKQ